MVLICLLNISSAAEGPLFSSGVDLSINIAILGSWFASNAFLCAFLTVWMARSTCPLLCGYSGIGVLWLKSHSLLKSKYSLAANSGPLSEITSKGQTYEIFLLPSL